MKLSDATKGAVLEKFVFDVHKYIILSCIAKGVDIQPDKVAVSYEETKGGELIGKAVIDILTLHRPLCTHPRDWWQAFKERWFPQWMLDRWPPRYCHVEAEYKFPEMNPPESVLGRQFVHLKVLDEDKIRKDLERGE